MGGQQSTFTTGEGYLNKAGLLNRENITTAYNQKWLIKQPSFHRVWQHFYINVSASWGDNASVESCTQKKIEHFYNFHIFVEKLPAGAVSHNRAYPNNEEFEWD